MPRWILDPGCERVIREDRPMGKASTMDMKEIIRRVIAQGAQVDEASDRVAIYPADKSQAPVFLSHKHVSERDLTEAIRRLRRAGLDVENPPEETPMQKFTPADVPAKLRTNGGRPTLEYTPIEDIPSVSPKIDPRPTDLDAVLEMLAAAERRISLLETGLRAQDDILLITDRLDRRLHVLERGGAGASPPSKAQLTREAVLAFFHTVPGVKMSPQMVQANLEDELPKDLGKTDVATACNDLAKAGLISGRASTDGANRPRGIYWLEKEVAPNE